MSKIYVFPTETVYGIGVKLYDTSSLKLIYKLKKRPIDKKIAVLISNVNQINDFGVLNDKINKLINKFFPGPLTIIINSNLKYQSTYNEDTVGIRMPNHQVALSVIDEYGPLKTTSVNLNNEPPLNDLKVIKEKFINDNIIFFENDMTNPNNQLSNTPSTVIDATDPDNIKLIREGSIKFVEIINYLQSNIT